MKHLGIVVLALIINLLSINSFAQPGVEGEWIVGEQNTVVKIEQQNKVYSGKIVSSDNSDVKVGLPMVKDLKQTKGKWEGRIYSPKRNEWYDAEFTPKGNKLMVELSVGYFSKTMEWKKNK